MRGALVREGWCALQRQTCAAAVARQQKKRFASAPGRAAARCCCRYELCTVLSLYALRSAFIEIQRFPIQKDAKGRTQKQSGVRQNGNTALAHARRAGCQPC